MQSVLMICEVNLGMGHLARMLNAGRALSRDFKVALVIVTAEPIEIDVPDKIEVQFIYRPRPPILSGHQTVTAGLLEIAKELQPAAIIVEFFPFARHASVFYLLPFFKSVRALAGSPIPVLCSIRDIQDHMLEALNADSVVRLANQHFDAILVHSDPQLTRLEDTFPAADRIRIPIHYTNYVSRHAYVGNQPAQRAKTILLSAGGGRGGERLLECALDAARQGLLQEYKLRILAGKFLLEQDWQRLFEGCAGAGDAVELLRWVPDLFTELRQAAVSVSRFGYNTTMDLLASGVPALVVPHTTPEADEQLRRAIILSRLGVVRMLHEDDMTPETLAAEILRTIDFQPSPMHVKLDGAERTCEIVRELVSARTLPAGVSAAV
jgi:predicted glycosyltransferase